MTNEAESPRTLHSIVLALETVADLGIVDTEPGFDSSQADSALGYVTFTYSEPIASGETLRLVVPAHALSTAHIDSRVRICLDAADSCFVYVLSVPIGL